MKKYTFYKETDEWDITRWYVDLPEWEGSKAELEMVAGADDMLDIIADGEITVDLMISLEPFDDADELNIIDINEEDKEIVDVVGGRFYILKKYENNEINLKMWLCNVVLFIFESFPEKLYIKKI